MWINLAQALLDSAIYLQLQFHFTVLKPVELKSIC